MEYLRIDMKHCRKSKRYRLSGTSLSNSNNISATESHRPCLTLDGGWRSESLCTNGRHQIFRKSDFVKRRYRPRDITSLNLYVKIKMVKIVKMREKKSANLDFFQTTKFLRLSLTACSNSLIFDIKVLLEMF